MSKIKKISGIFIVFLIIAMPVLSLAAEWEGLVPCVNTKEAPCDFNQLMAMVNIVINFILFKMALPLAAIMFAYAGITLLFGGAGSAEAKGKARGIFTNAVIGFALALAAWLIIHTILTIMGYNGSWIGL